MKTKSVIIIVLLFVQVSIGQGNLKNMFNQDVQILIDDSTENKNMSIKRWQIKSGFSFNNKNVYNIEGSYLTYLSNSFILSVDLRLYSFLSFTPTLSTKSLKLFDHLSFSPTIGLGIIGLGPVNGIEAFTIEFGLILRYLINENCNFILSYKQVTSSAYYPAFYSLPPKQLIENFPIRFLSIGLEI